MKSYIYSTLSLAFAVGLLSGCGRNDAGPTIVQTGPTASAEDQRPPQSDARTAEVTSANTLTPETATANALTAEGDVMDVLTPEEADALAFDEAVDALTPEEEAAADALVSEAATRVRQVNSESNPATAPDL